MSVDGIFLRKHKGNTFCSCTIFCFENMVGCEERVGVLVGWWKCVLRGCGAGVVFHAFFFFTQKRGCFARKRVADVKPAAILSHFEMPIFVSSQAYPESKRAPFLLLAWDILLASHPLVHWPRKIAKGN